MLSGFGKQVHDQHALVKAPCSRHLCLSLMNIDWAWTAAATQPSCDSVQAFADRAVQGIPSKPIERAKQEEKIKTFVRESVKSHQRARGIIF